MHHPATFFFSMYPCQSISPSAIFRGDVTGSAPKHHGLILKYANFFSQQYYAILITLHCPIAFEKSPQSQAPAKSPWAFSRKACQSYAIHISRIFSYHQQRFQVKNIFATGIQHAATAATALIGLIPFLDKPEDRQEARLHLLRLAQVLKANAETYVPAKRMHSAIHDAIRRCGFDTSDHSELGHDLGETYDVNQRLSSRNDTNVDSLLFKKYERLLSMPPLGDDVESLNCLDQQNDVLSHSIARMEDVTGQSFDLDSLFVGGGLETFEAGLGLDEAGFELDGALARTYSWDFGGCDTLNADGESFII